MPSRSLRESVKGAYRSAVQTTSDAMSSVSDYAKQASSNRRQRNLAEATEYMKSRQTPAPKAPAPGRDMQNYEPVAFRGVPKLKHKTDEAFRDMGE